jgi:tight adherence protein C
MIVPLFLSLLVAGVVFLIAKYLLDNMAKIGREGRVHNAYQNKKASIIMPTILRWAKLVGKFLARIKNKRFVNYVAKVSKDLSGLGGEFEKIEPHQFVALQLFAFVVMMFLCSISFSSNIIFMFFSGCIVAALPYLYIRQNLQLRKERISRQLPDMADLLSVMLESGSDFFGAAEKVCKILTGPLSDEFSASVSKIYLGYDKKLALTEMAQKCGVDQLSFFVRTVSMALDAGVGMADTLKRLAYSMRQERAAVAEKKAQEAPVKMLLPLVLFIFPTIFIVIFGPIAINFLKGSSGF